MLVKHNSGFWCHLIHLYNMLLPQSLTIFSVLRLLLTPFFLPFPRSIFMSYLFLCLFVCFDNPVSFIRVVYKILGKRLLMGTWGPYHWLKSWRKDFFSFPWPFGDHRYYRWVEPYGSSPWGWVEPPDPPQATIIFLSLCVCVCVYVLGDGPQSFLPLMTEFGQAQSCTDLVQVSHTLWDHKCTNDVTLQRWHSTIHHSTASGALAFHPPCLPLSLAEGARDVTYS